MILLGVNNGGRLWRVEEENQGGNNMARKPTGNPNGRPRKELNQQEFEDLCELQCTLEEIARVFRVDRDTVSAWCKRTYGEGFSAVFEKFSQGGKTSLRRTLLEHSKTNASVAIFLAKNLLGMTDKFDNNITTNIDENKKLAQELLEKFKDGGKKSGEKKDI